MPLARREFTVVDEHGDIVTDAQVEVRAEIAGQPLVSLFSDRDGAVPIGNPFSVDPTTAVAAFHVVGGAYRVRAFSGAFERIERYVPIGTAAETDAGLIPTSISTGWNFDDATADADPGSGEFRLNHATPASATAIYIDNENAGANSVTAWLDSLDDGGDSATRGQITVCDPDQVTEVFRIYRVSGSVVDGTGYRKLTVAHVAGAGSFTAGVPYSITFAPKGMPGVQAAADVSYAGGTGMSATNVETAIDELATEKQDAATALAQGKHTIWVPAGAMTPDASGGAASGTSTLTSITLKTLDYDQTSFEAAQFQIGAPKSWNEGTITFQPYWTAAAGSGAVVWQLAGHVASDDDTLSINYTNSVNSADTLIATNDLHIGPESSALTIGGTPAENDIILLRVGRLVSDGGDTLTADAKLIGVKIFYTVNASTDA